MRGMPKSAKLSELDFWQIDNFQSAKTWASMSNSNLEFVVYHWYDKASFGPFPPTVQEGERTLEAEKATHPRPPSPQCKSLSLEDFQQPSDVSHTTTTVHNSSHSSKKKKRGRL